MCSKVQRVHSSGWLRVWRPKVQRFKGFIVLVAGTGPPILLTDLSAVTLVVNSAV